MIIKRSWVFALFSIWIPIVIFVLSVLSVWIASVSIEIDYIRTTIIAGNILMAVILLFSSWNYIRHFRELQMYSMITDDLNDLKKNLER